MNQGKLIGANIVTNSKDAITMGKIEINKKPSLIDKAIKPNGLGEN